MSGRRAAAIAVLTLVAAALGAVAPVHADGSLSLSSLFDSDHGRSLDVDARWSPVESWSLGAGVGKGATGRAGPDLSGDSLRASTDVYLGKFDAGVSLQRWKDSGEVKSRSLRAQVGMTFDNGLGAHLLFDDRSLDVVYSRQGALGQMREATVAFDGAGFGGELSFTGERMSVAANFISQSYGRSLSRVRSAIAATDTTRFPRLQLLAASLVTRAAGATDREIGVTLGRQFTRSSLQAQWLLLRDALTGDATHSLSLVHSHPFARHLEIDTTLGLSHGAADGTLAFGGLAFRIR